MGGCGRAVKPHVSPLYYVIANSVSVPVVRNYEGIDEVLSIVTLAARRAAVIICRLSVLVV